MKNYDYIILGAGAAGLMLAYKMAQDPFFNDRSILILDPDKRTGDDRTWCFWEEGPGEWDEVVAKKWETIFFGSRNFSKKLPLDPYSYKMIKSGKFFDSTWQVIEAAGNIDFVQEAYVSHTETGERVEVSTENSQFSGRLLFSSIVSNDFKEQKKYPVLNQHFIGWFVKTKSPHFDDTVATFMDFRLPQKGNTRFMYVLPHSPTEALFEYTLFSEDLLETAEYEEEIARYLERENILDYEIVAKERGCIPMTSFDFTAANTDRLLHIGTAGGWTRASTGFTFKNIMSKTTELLIFLKNDQPVQSFSKKDRYSYYDMIMLDVLSKDNSLGEELFATMFKKRKASEVLDFLSQKGRMGDDLRVMSAVPWGPFIRASLGRLMP